jgi:hypothetical protein
MTDPRPRTVSVHVPQGVNVAERRRRSQERERAQTQAETVGGPSPAAYDFLLGQAGGSRESDALPGWDDDEPGEEVTVVTSQLLRKLGSAGTTCPVCHHSFRLGEQISIERAETGPGVVLKHRSRLLDCLNPEAGAQTSATAALFHSGLDEANPPPAELSTVRLQGDHPLLRLHPGPGGGAPTRHRCWVCGHTFRPDEVVIHCTCSPHAPTCASAVHRDPDHGLVCYDDWKAQHPGVPCLMLNSLRDTR